MRINLILIDDDWDMIGNVLYLFEGRGVDKINAKGFDNPIAGLEAIANSKPDIVLLDWMMPGMNGLDVCRKIRQNPETSQVAVIMLTAKGNCRDDAAMGLDAGADDFISKPFHKDELLARIRAVLRRRNPALVLADVVKRGILELDGSAYSAWVNGTKVELSTTEFEILYYLSCHEGLAKTREIIFDRVFPQTTETLRTIDVHIGHIRRKLGPAGDYIKTINRVGYLFSSKS